MLTRRGFTGFASCAICAVTGFIASEASAQGAPPAVPGVKNAVQKNFTGRNFEAPQHGAGIALPHVQWPATWRISARRALQNS
jgi:hypothetical protein